MATCNKSSQVEQFYCQPLGEEKGKTYLISIATIVMMCTVPK